MLLLFFVFVSHGVAVEKSQTSSGIVFPSASVKITGSNARLEGTGQKYVAWWTDPDTFLKWTAEAPAAGRYRVEMEYSLPGMNNGGELSVAVGSQKLKAFPKVGAGPNDFQTGCLGEVSFDLAGKMDVIIRAVPTDHQYVIHIRSLSLVPADVPTTAVDVSGRAVEAGDDQSFILSAAEARIEGLNAVLIGDESDAKRIGFWKDIGTSLVWNIHVENAGKYRVEMKYSLAEADAGAKLAISVGQKKWVLKPIPGKQPGEVMTGEAGEITISDEGTFPVVLTPVSKSGAFLPDVISLALQPMANSSVKMIDIRDHRITQAGNGSLELEATSAEIDGEAIRLEGAGEKYLAWWNYPGRSIKWPVEFAQPGTYEISAKYARVDSAQTDQVQFPIQTEPITTLPNARSGKCKITVSVGGQTITHELKAGRDWKDFNKETLGTVTISETGAADVVITATERPGVLVMQLKSILLRPVQ